MRPSCGDQLGFCDAIGMVLDADLVTDAANHLIGVAGSQLPLGVRGHQTIPQKWGAVLQRGLGDLADKRAFSREPMTSKEEARFWATGQRQGTSSHSTVDLSGYSLCCVNVPTAELQKQ